MKGRNTHGLFWYFLFIFAIFIIGGVLGGWLIRPSTRNLIIWYVVSFFIAVILGYILSANSGKPDTDEGNVGSADEASLQENSKIANTSGDKNERRA